MFTPARTASILALVAKGFTVDTATMQMMALDDLANQSAPPAKQDAPKEEKNDSPIGKEQDSSSEQIDWSAAARKALRDNGVFNIGYLNQGCCPGESANVIFALFYEQKKTGKQMLLSRSQIDEVIETTCKQLGRTKKSIYSASKIIYEGKSGDLPPPFVSWSREGFTPGRRMLEILNKLLDESLGKPGLFFYPHMHGINLAICKTYTNLHIHTCIPSHQTKYLSIGVGRRQSRRRASIPSEVTGAG